MIFHLRSAKSCRHSRALSGVFFIALLLSLLYPLYSLHALHHDCSGDEDCAVCENLQAIACQLDAQNCTGGELSLQPLSFTGFIILTVFTVFIFKAVTPVSLKVKKSE